VTVPVLSELFREHWSRVLANLIGYTRDLDLAEDCAQEAFARAAALPEDFGRVENPAAWLTTVAKRIAVDRVRRDAVLATKLPMLAIAHDGDSDPTGDAAAAAVDGETSADADRIGDDRLRLVFVACHPAVGDEARLALALRLVCGLSTAEIAHVFLVAEPTMAARLTRAKRRVRSRALPFALPELSRLRERLASVRDTVYLFYTSVHASPVSDDVIDRGVASAVSMSRALARLFPDDTESLGLLALILLTEARRKGRMSAAGNPLALEEVDRTAWNQAWITEGLDLAARALPGGGRLALQAGISGLHSAASDWESTPWPSIAALYERLIVEWPAPAARLGAIIANSQLPDADPEQALTDLDELAVAAEPMRRQLFAARGDILRRAGRHREAIVAYDLAAREEPDAAVRAFLLRRVEESRGRSGLR
jgi:RNA polymerase sigma factor, sigma-70 family